MIISSISSLIIIVLGVTLFMPIVVSQPNVSPEQTTTVTPKQMRAVTAVTLEELKQELQEKGLEISAMKAIEIAEESGGQVLTIRLRRLKDGKLGYSVILLKNEPVSLVEMVIHGITGAVIMLSEISEYGIAINYSASVVVPEETRGGE